MQEILKGIPDNKLMEEMQQPSGSAPSFLVMTELERRKKEMNTKEECNRSKQL